MKYWLIPILIVSCGLFAIVCAARDYEWFMGHRKAQLLIKIIGRTATRLFYITIGVALTVVGAVLFFNPAIMDS